MPLDKNSPVNSERGVYSPFDLNQTVGESVEGPGVKETFAAGFRADNEVGSFLASDAWDLSGAEFRRVDPSYNPFKNGDLEGYEEHADRFLDAHNATSVSAIKSDIDREKQDQETLEAAGWLGMAAQVTAGVASPSTLLPGGALVRAGRVGFSAGRSALSVGLAAGAGAAVQEGALQATQQTRDMGDSAFVVGGSVILGGILGAGGAQLLTGRQFKRFSKALEDDLADDTPHPGEVSQEIIKRLKSAGAAAAEDINLDDLEIGGPRAVAAITAASNAVRLNPGLELLTSNSSRARRVFLDLAENHVATAGELEGRTAGAAVETAMKQWQRGGLATFLGDLKTNFKAARVDGWQGSRKEFNEAVAKAARRNDTDPNGNAHVEAAARSLRNSLLEPMKGEAIDTGLLSEMVRTVTAPSYLHRVWNTRRVIGEESRFRSIVTDWARGVVDDAMLKQEEIGIARNISAADDLGERLGRALERLENIEGRLSERAKGRAQRLDQIRKAEGSRFDVLRGRVPAHVIDVAKAADDNAAMLDAVREVAKAPKQVKRPMLGILKERGGVRIGSPLDAELRHMGVTPKTAPGLFKNNSGLSAVDNFPASEEPLFARMATDQNGYADPNDILAAIRDEMAGAPVRTDDELFAEAARDVLEQNVEQWLSEIGLPPNATAKQVREYLDRALGNEARLSDLDQRIGRMQGDLEEFDRLTDEIGNERLIAKAEADKFTDELNELEAKINDVREFANASPRVKLLVDYADARKAYAKGRYEQTRLGNRIEAIERVEADGKATPEMIDELRALRSDKNAVDERVIKAGHRRDKLKPMLPKDRGDELDFLDPKDKDGYIAEIVDGIFDNITGKLEGDAPAWIVPVTQGPLKGRTFKIPDELVEDFLENDVEMIARRYVRTMAAEVELTRKFGRADMKDQIAAIRQDYKELRAAAPDEKTRAKLENAERRDIRHIEAFRDMLRGTYRAGEDATAWSTFTRLALGWNFITKLGGVTLSSLPDLFSTMTKQGLRAFMDDGLAALGPETKALRIAKRDARELGAITETVLQSRLAELADLHDPYASGNIADRIMSNVTGGFAKLTFLDRWNDMNKTVVSVMTTNKIARLVTENLDDVPSKWGVAGKQVSFAKMSKYERAFLGKLGIDEAMATRIAAQVQSFGVQEKGIWGLNVSKWSDGDARRAFAAALNKEVDGTIITPGIADKPLWARSNLGKLVMQFKSFGLASHQRLLLSRLQGNSKHLAEFLLLGTLGGMMVSYLKLIERGDFEGAERLTENPGLWIADGFDRTGIASVLMDVSNTAEKVGAPFGVRTAAQLLAGDDDLSADVSRYASRNAAGAFLGPWVGNLQDVADIAAASNVAKSSLSSAEKANLKKKAAQSILRNTPGGTLPGVRTFMGTVVKPAVTGE